MTDTINDKVRFVSWLIDKGTRLGFHSERCYTSPEDGAVADAAWILNPGQKPVFTFSVVEDPTGLMASTIQWTGSSTEPKSWVHICIAISEQIEMPPSLPVGVRGYTAESLDSLSHAFEDLTDKMIRFLRIFTDDESVGDRYETVKRLSSKVSTWPGGMWSSRLTLEANTTFGDALNLFAAEGLEDEETDVPALKPSRKVVPVDLMSGVTGFEGALIRLVDAGGGHLLLSTEHRNYPSIFRLTAIEGGESYIDLWFDADKSNIPQALRFSEFVESVKTSGSLTFSTPSGVLVECTLKPGRS